MTAEREELADLIAAGWKRQAELARDTGHDLALDLRAIATAILADTLEEAAKHVERIFAHLTRIADPDTLNTAKAVLAPVIDAIRALKGM